ncbi:hypothetical protein PIB30_038627 [Stylosanthes scabra]|uniref:Uncharacterized protein n=2 Tax=Stylosanthes scabra TaxID=79078 RepID=A0ABU6UCQ1_9FABA|nr:hypothetical protein [Stylosanthes scabra]
MNGVAMVVEGDGRLVPATDDEVMEMEDFLEHENSEMRVVADTGQSLECISIERSSSGKLRLECPKGTADADFGKLNAKLQYIEQMLQKVKQEERLRLSCESPVRSCAKKESQCSVDKFPVMVENNQSDTPHQEIPSLASSLNYTHSNQSGSVDQCSRPSEGVMESGSSASAVYSALNPDFSMFDGEICLDKLSIRELHELFKVTFGRETTVKDKQWLKRRIAMSLTNSHDVSATTFIIKDNKIMRKCEDSSGNGDSENVISMDNPAGEADINFKHSSALEGCVTEDNQVVSEIKPGKHDMENGLRVEDHQRAAKRIRKPTKRYIEELSETESREPNPTTMLSSSRNFGPGLSTTSYVRLSRDTCSEMRTFITRVDSLGGSDVQVPCVSRVRRSHPRKDITSLTKFLPIDVAKDAKLDNKALGENGSCAASENPEKVLKARSTPGKFQPMRATETLPSSEPEKEQQLPGVSTNEPQQESRTKRADPPSHPSEDNIVTVPTAKGGMRRKHHRAWTPVEVMKLVDGVSQCGAGKWSEIKRLSFSSHSYRTSVDLKDKWRNLLKASFAQTPADEGMNVRKHGTAPIPETILVRVRELAGMNSQAPPNFSSRKLVAGAGNAHGHRSGYL